MMQGLIVRVGIDSSCGNWLAPVDPVSNEFAYVTVPEDGIFRENYQTSYDQFVPVVKKFNVELPGVLRNQLTHLDPDFSKLTYGDQKRKAAQIVKLSQGDLLVFIAGLQPIRKYHFNILYGIIGIFVIVKIVKALDVPKNNWGTNAHTRRKPGNTDIVVFGDSKRSGRLEKCIPIGEWRNGLYRLRKGLMEKWGGISSKDGAIQRSGAFPRILNPAKFLTWFNDQNIRLIRRNN